MTKLTTMTQAILPNDNDLATYAYSYPHKSSYRRLSPPMRIAEAWRDEDVNHLSLYLHIPFCEMRCGFCNLFTQSRPASENVDAYLATLARQMAVIRREIPRASFDQFAIGGGTPTFLAARQLESAFHSIERNFSLSIRNTPTSVETSPATATNDRLDILAGFGIQRVSLGVQSFLEEETRGIGRPQSGRDVHQALEAIRSRDFPVLNIDLIYGDRRQSRQAWLFSLEEALRYEPEELYLYPLYVRPETGLAKTGHSAARQRSDLYRAARDRLRELGYIQSSLRCFRLPRNRAPSTYACQRDGMIGLGCGGRSYTQRLHYASRFAVTRAGVRAILHDWIAQSEDDLAYATHGISLSGEEQRRRYLIMSLLQAEGMRLADFHALFRSSPDVAVPELGELRRRGWLEETPQRLALNASGLEHSDEVGPLLYSEAVRSALREFIRL